MSVPVGSNLFLPERTTRSLLIKWIVALFVPVAVFTFIWSGEAIVNNVLLGVISPGSTDYSTPSLIQAVIFIVVFYAVIMALTGYLVAADSGRRGMIGLWIDVLIFVVVPIFLIISVNDLFLGLALCAIIWPIYFFVRKRVFAVRQYVVPPPSLKVEVTGDEQRAELMRR